MVLTVIQSEEFAAGFGEARQAASGPRTATPEERHASSRIAETCRTPSRHAGRSTAPASSRHAASCCLGKCDSAGGGDVAHHRYTPRRVLGNLGDPNLSGQTQTVP